MVPDAESADVDVAGEASVAVVAAVGGVLAHARHVSAPEEILGIAVKQFST